MDSKKIHESKFKQDLPEIAASLKALRTNKELAIDVSFSEFVKKKYGIGMESYYDELGLNPNIDTIENVVTTSGYTEYTFLVPEIIREALILGLRRAPIYPNVVASEQPVSGLTIKQPHIEMSDAAPKRVAEGETIPVGKLNFGQKSITIGKIGRGIKMTYEVRQYVSLNVLAVFLQDFGVKLGQALDTLLINVLLNGEQADGSESAPVVGIATANTLTYKDLLKVWVRMSLLGKVPNTMIAGEDMSLDILDLTEFKTNQFGGNTPAGVPTSNALRVNTPLPRTSNHYIHGAVPDDQVIVMDPNSTVIKYNAQPLLIEQDKIISNQTMEAYASLTTGYGIIYRDSRVVIDKGETFAANPFPSYMDYEAQEIVQL